MEQVTLKIKSIKKLPNKHHVYDLSVPGNHNFYIGNQGNILTHNCDSMTSNAQLSLRAIIEEFSKTTRFIFTCNHIEKVIDPIQSRCQVITIVPPSKSDIARHLVAICNEEKIKYELSDIGKIVNQNYPDIRKMLNIIQSSNVDGIINLDKGLLVSSNYMDKVLIELKKPKPNFLSIRQLIIDCEDTSFTDFYRFLFNKSSEYMPGNEGTAAILINEHQYQAQFSIDKQINICSLIYNLIKNKK